MVTERSRARSSSRRIGTGLLVGAALALVACDDPAGIEAPAVATVTVGPVGHTVVVGDTVRFSATVKGADGSVIEGLQVQWTTGDEDVATVAAQAGTGLVTAKAAGTVQITARAGGKTGATALSVTQQPPVAVTIRITPEAPALRVGDRVTLEGSLRTAEDEIVEGSPIEWTTSDATTAALEPGDAPGRIVVHALKTGIVTISARSGTLENGIQIGISEGAPDIVGVDVTPASVTLAPGGRTALRAWLRTAQGDLLPDGAIMWSISDTAVVALELGSGPDRIIVRGVRAGNASVTARYGTYQNSAQILVEAGTAVGSMEMRPAALTLETSRTQTLYVHAWGLDGGWLEDAAVQWRSLDNTVVAVSGTGRAARVLGVRPGTTQVVATAGAVSVTSTITVRDALGVGTVIITPGEPTAWAGSLLRFQARVVSTTGGELTGYPVAWSVADTTIATIEADGLLHARKAGTTQVRAASGGREATVSLRVYPAAGGQMVFDLNPSLTPAGDLRTPVSLGDTTWTDPTGTTHPAKLVLTGGDLTVDLGTWTWTQVLRVETMASMNGILKTVSVALRHDRGRLGAGVIEPWHFFFTSVEHAGTMFEGRMPTADRMVIEQSLTGTTVRDYVWIRR